MLTPICSVANDDVKMFLRVYYNEAANSQRGYSFIEMSDGFGLLHLLLSLNYVYIERVIMAIYVHLLMPRSDGHCR